MPITIRSIKTIVTAPNGLNLLAVKIETSEPGLYGVGCATFTWRFAAVKAAIDEHVAPLLIGRDVDRIEELWQLMNLHGYWRNGPVLNNAMSGVDMALWDIKGKIAKMPLYQLFGGKVREGVAPYLHAGDKTHEGLDEKVRIFRENNIRHVRIQLGGYGASGTECPKIDNCLEGAYYDPRMYMVHNLKALEHIRETHGDGIEILHDVHERLRPALAVEYAKQCEKLHLFFLEDILAPEDVAWFDNIRSVCATPLAMGELFVHPLEWVPLVANRKIDFVRMHISDIGGITPARKVAALCEAFGVKTAWHGPPDMTGMAHAANVHLDLSSPAFGIQEFSPGFGNALKPNEGGAAAFYACFPGTPVLKKGYLYPSENPGLGVDIDEEECAKFPPTSTVHTWTQTRLHDGSMARP